MAKDKIVVNALTTEDVHDLVILFLDGKVRQIFDSDGSGTVFSRFIAKFHVTKQLALNLVLLQIDDHDTLEDPDEVLVKPVLKEDFKKVLERAAQLRLLMSSIKKTDDSDQSMGE